MSGRPPECGPDARGRSSARLKWLIRQRFRAGTLPATVLANPGVSAMSLTFQLARGGIALAVVVVLSAAAWLAPASSPNPRVAWIAETEAAATACPLPLRLASAPADLPKTRRHLA